MLTVLLWVQWEWEAQGQTWTSCRPGVPKFLAGKNHIFDDEAIRIARCYSTMAASATNQPRLPLTSRPTWRWTINKGSQPSWANRSSIVTTINQHIDLPTSKKWIATHLPILEQPSINHQPTHQPVIVGILLLLVIFKQPLSIKHLSTIGVYLSYHYYGWTIQYTIQ